ncbi:WxL domain-containing protein [Lactobacillus sp. W8089]|nr:WxL domain-containing protein [Lactobacillus sp. W8086]MBI0109509.1 WxL domain-containing protein [Lactobacillus sp. W8085]MBI0112576.1 WxL domain-containing protein [Lactobacillus sp. W8088]MBI0116292.1 WxL domain-containing protein [Lactobacillus sp. W8087]MBI0120166.1 WxL domain-containing protein [Lactobacillus sp. W8089]MBI0132131.1 WxL domain-containing protein [Lactobacillus sp. W8090]
MKMGKLFSSIATATMVLTTLAPAAVANAATGHATNVAGSGVSEKVSNGSLPMATSSSKDDQTPANSATAQSDANVKVIDGFLVLNNVPDLGFGVAIAGNTVKLHDGNSMRDDDGNAQGILEVVDSRKADSANGFTVTASLGEFADSKNTTYNAGTDGPNFVLTLNSFGVQQHEQFGGEGTEQAVLTAGDSTAKNVVQAGKNSRGTHTFKYQNATDRATLSVPAAAKADEYSASITWSLAPTAA